MTPKRRPTVPTRAGGQNRNQCTPKAGRRRLCCHHPGRADKIRTNTPPKAGRRRVCCHHPKPEMGKGEDHPASPPREDENIYKTTTRTRLSSFNPRMRSRSRRSPSPSSQQFCKNKACDKQPLNKHRCKHAPKCKSILATHSSWKGHVNDYHAEDVDIKDKEKGQSHPIQKQINK
jgi:hypothetical protein